VKEKQDQMLKENFEAINSIHLSNLLVEKEKMDSSLSSSLQTSRPDIIIESNKESLENSGI
jgi:hypothetical protein